MSKRGGKSRTQSRVLANGGPLGEIESLVCCFVCGICIRDKNCFLMKQYLCFRELRTHNSPGVTDFSGSETEIRVSETFPDRPGAEAGPSRGDEVDTPPKRPWWRFALSLSLSTFMVLILVVGGVLGWVARRERIQGEAVAAIERAGGRVLHAPMRARFEVDIENEYRYSEAGVNRSLGGSWPTWFTDWIQAGQRHEGHLGQAGRCRSSGPGRGRQARSP